MQGTRPSVASSFREAVWCYGLASHTREVHLVRLSASQVGHLFGFQHQHPRRILNDDSSPFKRRKTSSVSILIVAAGTKTAPKFAPLSIGNTQDYCLADLSIGLK